MKTGRSNAANRSARDGVAMLHVVMGIALFAVLAGGMAMMVGTSSMSTAYPVCQKRAVYLAESGIRYAMGRLRAAATPGDVDTELAAMNGQTYTMDNGDTFTLTIVDNRPSFTVSCSASSCSGTQAAARLVQATFNVPVTDTEVIEFEQGMDNFTETGEGDSSGETDDAVIKDGEGESASFGNNLYGSYGCLWYEGNVNPCTDGNCTFGTGLRAYFNVTFARSSQGDGITFGVKSMETNTLADCGGDPSRGEYLGYSGPGVSGNGIRPPKMAVEFDIWRNSCNNPCVTSSRCDDNNYDHVAAVYWGQNSLSCDNTRDDNRHGAGSNLPDEPMNPDNWMDNEEGWDGYYYRTTNNHWLDNGVRVGGNWNATAAVRIEIHRSDTADENGNYLYTTMAWVRQQDQTMAAGYDDVTGDFIDPPDMIDTKVLDANAHDLLNQIAFGWTEGTGAATQIATVDGFKLMFRDENDTAEDVPTDYVAGWPANEGTGITLYDSNATGGNDGTVYRNSGGQPYDAQWVTGAPKPFTTGVRMTNRRGTIHAPDAPELDLTTQGSVSLWFYLDDFDDYAGLLHKGDASSFWDEAYTLQFYNRRLLFAIQPAFGSFQGVYSSFRFNRANVQKRWWHAVGTWDNTTFNLYLNGQLDNSAPNVGGIAAQSTSGGLNIGAQLYGSFNNYVLDGVVDQVYLWDRVLTADEVLSIYQQGAYQ
ncbi:LamG domain-containing protein [Salidesulfovibrio brasiliensis]|uniref:LamG domain-containing protein n=1 Tax=Salidesulfovibrio brasiliensis TaxID=221711 RepID=UPI0006CF9925|nr:LamG domain-containing protein [Salidesulfovibrio brasiliensis]